MGSVDLSLEVVGLHGELTSSRDGLRCGFQCVDQAVQLVGGDGGKVLVPPVTTPNGLAFAHLLDRSGNRFGVFSRPA